MTKVLDPTPHAARQGAAFLPGQSVRALAEEAIRAGAIRGEQSRIGATVKVEPLGFARRVIYLELVDRGTWRPINVRRVTEAGESGSIPLEAKR